MLTTSGQCSAGQCPLAPSSSGATRTLDDYSDHYHAKVDHLLHELSVSMMSSRGLLQDSSTVSTTPDAYTLVGMLIVSRATLYVFQSFIPADGPKQLQQQPRRCQTRWEESAGMLREAWYGRVSWMYGSSAEARGYSTCIHTW